MTRSVNCDSCGKVFEAKSPRAKYCSQPCRQSAYRERRGEVKSGYPISRPDLFKTYTFDSSISANQRAIDGLTQLGTAVRMLDAATKYLDEHEDRFSDMFTRDDVAIRQHILDGHLEALVRVQRRLAHWNATHEQRQRALP